MTYARTRADQGKSMALAVAVHLGLGAALLSGLAVETVRRGTDSIASFDVVEVPPALPDPPKPQPQTSGAKEEAAPPNLRSKPLPIVAPPPRVPLPALQPASEVRAPVEGTDRTAGAAAVAGPGTGAGGVGDGFGGGGTGNSGVGSGALGSPARLVRGMRSRLDHRFFVGLAPNAGSAVLALTIGPEGRVLECGIVQGTGSAALDGELCRRMAERSRWSPARDLAGRPIPAKVHYTATWSRPGFSPAG